MTIPFMRLDRQFQDCKPVFMAAVENVFTHGKVLQGAEVLALEARVADFFHLEHGAAVGSGTDALVLSLKAMDIGPGCKVAVTSLSFQASASAIVLAGAQPVFVDVEETYGMARTDVLLDLVAARKVDALIAVHLYGQMAELRELYDLARQNDVKVIEDAAQVLGAFRGGKPAGQCSDVACVSFDPTKVIGAQGSGGIALTDNAAIAERIRRLRYHGHAGGRVYAEIGHNSQLPTVQAAILNCKLDRELPWRRRRQDIAAAYGAVLAPHPDVQPPAVMPGNEHNYHKYVMRVPVGRDRLAEHLAKDGVKTTVHYTKALHTQPCFEGRSETVGDMAAAGRMVGQVLSLPIYPELTDAEVAQICDSLAHWRA